MPRQVDDFIERWAMRLGNQFDPQTDQGIVVLAEELAHIHYLIDQLGSELRHLQEHVKLNLNGSLPTVR